MSSPNISLSLQVAPVEKVYVSIIGKYRKIKEIAVGGYGTVDLVEYDGKYYAMKTQRTECCSSIKFGISGRTLMEADILRRVQHPNLSKTHHIFYSYDEKKNEAMEGALHFVSELATDNLTNWSKSRPLLTDDGKISPVHLSGQEFVNMAHQILLGLDMLHRHDILHGDLTPNNILVFEEKGFPTFKLTDFGLSERINPGYPRYKDYITSANYRAPENLISEKNYSLSSDIFSYGKILLYIFFNHINTKYNIDPSMLELYNKIIRKRIDIDEWYRQRYLLETYSMLGRPTKIWFIRNGARLIPEYYEELPTERKSIDESYSRDFKRIYEDDYDLIVNLIDSCLKYDPLQRSTTQKLLQHDIFKKYGLAYNDKVGSYIGTVSPGVKLTLTQQEIYSNIINMIRVNFTDETLILAYDIMERLLAKLSEKAIKNNINGLIIVSLDIAYRLVQEKNILSEIELYFTNINGRELFSLELIVLKLLDWVLYPDNLLTMCKLNSKVAGNVIKYIKQGSKKEHLHKRMMERAFAGMCDEVNKVLN